MCTEVYVPCVPTSVGSTRTCLRPCGLQCLFLSTSYARLAQIMVSRLVLSLRKSADRTINVTEFISEELSFGSNPGLPLHTQSQIESSFSPKRRSSVSYDARYCQSIVRSFSVLIPSPFSDTTILSPLSLSHSSNID